MYNVTINITETTEENTIVVSTPNFDAEAVHIDRAGEISGLTNKPAPVAADVVMIEDSEDSMNKKKISFGNIPMPSVPVDSVFGRTGDVVGESGDYSADEITDGHAGTVQGSLDVLYERTEFGLPGIEWRSSILTLPGPASGYFRYNHGTTANVTAIYVSKTSIIGKDVGALVPFYFRIGDEIYVQQDNDSNRWQRWALSGNPVDNGTYFTLPVIYVDSGSHIQDLRNCTFIIRHL